jgi:hypothetical protein
MFDWDAVPHNGMPYVQIGFNMALYINSLLVTESLDFLPMIQKIIVIVKIIIDTGLAKHWPFNPYTTGVFLHVFPGMFVLRDTIALTICVTQHWLQEGALLATLIANV